MRLLLLGAALWEYSIFGNPWFSGVFQVLQDWLCFLGSFLVLPFGRGIDSPQKTCDFLCFRYLCLLQNLILVLFFLWKNPFFPPILLVPQWFFRAVEREEMNQCGGSSGLHESVSELQGNVLLSSCSPCTQSSLHGREEVEPGGLAVGLEGEFCSTYRCLGGFQ